MTHRMLPSVVRRSLLHCAVAAMLCGCRGKAAGPSEDGPPLPPPSEEAKQVLDRLSKAEPAALTDLLEQLAKVDGKAYYRRPEVAALVPRLERALDGSPDRAMEAASALIYVGPPASRTVPKILKAVAHFAEAAGEGRRMLAMIVVYIPGWGEPGIRALSGALDDPDERVWRSALVVLTNPGVVNAENVGLFTLLLGHRRAEVRKDVVVAIGREGTRLRHVVPKVEPLLRDRDAEVRRAAQFAIEQLNGVRNRRGDLIGVRGLFRSPLPPGGEG